MIKLVLFDFDDTLFLKRKRVFIPKLLQMLQQLRSQHIHIVILTCNHKAKDIITSHHLDNFFQNIIYVDARAEYKSEKIIQILFPEYAPSSILFFDNDPLHIYDVSKNCDIRSFLVNGYEGLKEDLVLLLVDHQYSNLRVCLQRELHNSSTTEGNYLTDRIVALQNLMELDKIKN